MLCEKTLALSTEEVQEILASTKMNDVFLMEAGRTLTPQNIQIKPKCMSSPVGCRGFIAAYILKCVVSDDVSKLRHLHENVLMLLVCLVDN